MVNILLLRTTVIWLVPYLVIITSCVFYIRRNRRFHALLLLVGSLCWSAAAATSFLMNIGQFLPGLSRIRESMTDEQCLLFFTRCGRVQEVAFISFAIGFSLLIRDILKRKT